MPTRRTQKTPKGEEIPVPKRKDFDAVLDAAAKPVKKSREPFLLDSDCEHDGAHRTEGDEGAAGER